MSKLQQLAQVIDDELAAQVAVQTGCEYHRMDECGVSSGNLNIVLTQLARKVIEFLDFYEERAAQERRAEEMYWRNRGYR